MDTIGSKIAVVGIGAQLPSGGFSDVNLNYKTFFDFLLQGADAYEKIPHERFNIKYLQGKAIGQIGTDTGTFLKDLEQFDFLEFGVTAKDARSMSLSTRKLVETAFLSLQDSGIDYRGKNVGCYMSGITHDILTISGHSDMEAVGSFGYAPAAIANRVSYHLDLRGPSIPLDTACSSSLYTTHLAMQALRNGDCDAAVVGGSQLNLRFMDWLSYTQGGILSPDGKCKPFDSSANGFSRGEGVVVIVLKPLEAAIRDGDHIYATILATAVNSSGSLAPVNAPVASAQRDAMRRAFQQTDRLPQEVDFLELHATGTAQGDPTEANWVGEEFKRDGELIIGSVKGNIGHTEITAFLASLCKVCGIFETGLIPPNVNFFRPNPAIRWSDYHFRVPKQAETLGHRIEGRPPLVAMTSSGIGGANGHAVIEGPPVTSSLVPSFWTDPDSAPSLLVAGGLSPRSASAIGESLLETLVEGDRKGLSRVMGRRARSMTWRSYAVVDVDAEKPVQFSDPVLVPKQRGPVVFVFSGQGPQYYQMGRELFKCCVPFRESILELDEVYTSRTGKSLLKTTGLFDGSPDPLKKDPLGDPWPISITLPALTMVQVALVDTLAALGVKPDVVVGHSAGETAVLYASGSASKAMTLEVAIARGQAMSLLEGHGGTMAAISCSPEDLQRIVDEVRTELGEGTLDLGCFNSASATVVSGLETHTNLVVKKAIDAGILSRKLPTRVPVHSQMMALCRSEFLDLVGDVFSRHVIRQPTAKVYSTVTGQLFQGTFDAEYMWNGTLGPVLFSSAITAVHSDHSRATYVEIGPHPVLINYVSTMVEKNNILCPLRRRRAPTPQADVVELLSAVGKLIVDGHNCVDFDVLSGVSSFSGTLPPYPFASRTVPWRIDTQETARQLQERKGPLNYPQLQINIRTHPELADHVIKDEPIMSAAGFMEMALEFGANTLYDVEFLSLLPLSSESPVPVDVRLKGTRWCVCSASPNSQSSSWPLQYSRVHTTGFLSLEPAHDAEISQLDINALRSGMKATPMKDFYQKMTSFAQFGFTYQRIEECHISRDSRGRTEVLTKVQADLGDLPSVQDYRFHPAIMDAAIHVVVHPLVTGNHDAKLYYLPSKVTKLQMHPRSSTTLRSSYLYSYSKLVAWRPDAITFDIVIADIEGHVICTLDGLEIARHGQQNKAVERRFDVLYSPLGHYVSGNLDYIPDSRTVHSQAPEATRPLLLPTSDAIPPDPSSSSSSSASSPSTRTTALSDDTTPSSAPSLPPAIIHEYIRGGEMKIQDAIRSLDPSSSLSLLLIAVDGLDGAAVLGFTRSLRREFPLWRVQAVVFDASWSLDRRTQAAREIATLDLDEPEVTVDSSGVLHVPRVELVSSPTSLVPFSSEKPWLLDGETVTQTRVPQDQEDHVIVSVHGVASSYPGLWEFVGKTEGSNAWSIGIGTGAIASHVSVHKSAIIQESDEVLADGHTLRAPSLLAATIVAVATDTRAFSHPERNAGMRVLIHDVDAMLGSSVLQVCKDLGLPASFVASLSASDLEGHYRNKPHIVLSSSLDSSEIDIFHSLVQSSRGRVFLWNHSSEGIPGVTANDPWMMGDALRCAQRYCKTHSSEPILYRRPRELLPALPDLVSVNTQLFHPDRTYVLLGGMGSLGLQAALWMYENGARHLVLTSRSGIATLERSEDWIAKRVYYYLREREDLSLQVSAVDATSSQGMQDLFRGFEHPVGGCLLMTVVYKDRSFTAHTEETFESTFPAKVKAFQVLEEVIDIAGLDFLVTFSSVSAMFGNAGQTNYSAANTSLAALTQKYKNAFSLVTPAIVDSSSYIVEDEVSQLRLRNTRFWGMSGQELCRYLGDGIRKLRDGPVRQYIPDFDWRGVRDGLGPLKLYEHLVPQDTEQEASGESDQSSLLAIVCRVLGLKEEDTAPAVPLTSYGLDSLSAVALSFALKPLIAISQLQLLADVSVKDLQEKIEQAASAAVVPETDTNMFMI